jgi:hypothetical protein
MPIDDSPEVTDTLPSGPFLGRRMELARLCRAVEEARFGGAGRLWIVGPSGIGKSRLLDEIARYAAWRHVPVAYAGSQLDPCEPGIGPGLLIVDPVAPTHVERVDDRLRQGAERGILGLATTSSPGRCLRSGIPEASLISLEGLDPKDSLRLLGACLGSALDPAWARRVARSTRGHPERMRQAAERLLTTRHGGRSRVRPLS